MVVRAFVNKASSVLVYALAFLDGNGIGRISGVCVFKDGSLTQFYEKITLKYGKYTFAAKIFDNYLA